MIVLVDYNIFLVLHIFGVILKFWNSILDFDILNIWISSFEYLDFWVFDFGFLDFGFCTK